MFNFMLKHKKGFTLVELIVVMALMGFGVVALANLFQTAYRSFNKAEERYIKQEMVKSVAEYLQTSISIGAATKAEIYPNTSVVPLKAGEDLSYHYVYAEKSPKLDGYYLYKLERGQAKSQAVCINPETPLYITFSAYQDEDYVGSGEIKNQCGIKVRIAAVDNSFQYKEDSYYTEEKTEAAEIEDYILKEVPNVINIFVHADLEFRKERAIRINNVEPAKAEDAVLKMDKRRANYYNYHSGEKWGKATNYDLAVNSSHIGIDNAVECIKAFIDSLPQ